MKPVFFQQSQQNLLALDNTLLTSDCLNYQNGPLKSYRGCEAEISNSLSRPWLGPQDYLYWKRKVDPNNRRQRTISWWNSKYILRSSSSWDKIYKTDSIFSHHSWSSRLYINFVRLSGLWLPSFPMLSRVCPEGKSSVGDKWPSLLLMYFL